MYDEIDFSIKQENLSLFYECLLKCLCASTKKIDHSLLRVSAETNKNKNQIRFCGKREWMGHVCQNEKKKENIF